MSILNKVTLKTLARNKTRTFVTILGIILSVALITAITTSISSLSNFMVETIEAQSGKWHGVIYDVTKDRLTALGEDETVTETISIENIGYAKLEHSANDSKPYLFIGGVSDNFNELLPVHIIQGRMPENTNEIILPEHLGTNGGVSYKPGDMLILEIGSREWDGEVLGQQNSIHYSDELEIFVPKETKTYKIVGFYERPSYEPYFAPGYLALTAADNSGDSYDAYITMEEPNDVYEYLQENYPENDSNTNQDYLRAIGRSNDESFFTVIYSLAAILIGIIVFGSISLIYNAFSISVSERTMQFGLLSSVGATKKQISRSVIFEALFLCVIGIPLGILVGIAGIGITFILSENLFEFIVVGGGNATIHLSVSVMAVVIAVVLGFFTVMISAYIPARRAMRITAIDAIRQSKDIVIKSKKVKTSKVVYKLFGFEGMLARKNFKRNKKKYKATVFSLFLSIVLFVSANSFCAYMNKSLQLTESSNYDLMYSVSGSSKDNIQEIYNVLSSVKGVRQSSYHVMYDGKLRVNQKDLNQEYRELAETVNSLEYVPLNNEEAIMNAAVAFIDDRTFEEYLRQNAYGTDKYMDAEKPQAIAIAYGRIFSSQDEKYHTFEMLNPSVSAVKWLNAQKREGFKQVRQAGWHISEDEAYVIYIQESGEESIKVPLEEAFTTGWTHTVGMTGAAFPIGIGSNYLAIQLLYPHSAMETVLSGEEEGKYEALYFAADDPKQVYDDMCAALIEQGFGTDGLYNNSEQEEAVRSLIKIVNIFIYGFIIMISLIATANVFNTISTNIGLRRREFAMLKSIGMTQKGFRKMMNFECLLYGIKGIIYGIPVAVGVTWLIYQGILNGWEISFFIPWEGLVIAVGSVFAVVFATMLYSMNKIKKDNTIDALRNENL